MSKPSQAGDLGDGFHPSPRRQAFFPRGTWQVPPAEIRQYVERLSSRAGGGSWRPDPEPPSQPVYGAPFQPA